MTPEDVRPERVTGELLRKAMLAAAEGEREDNPDHARACRDVAELAEYWVEYEMTGDLWDGYAVERFVPVWDTLSQSDAPSVPVIAKHITSWGCLVMTEGGFEGEPVRTLAPGHQFLTAALDAVECERVTARPFGMLEVTVRSQDSGRRYSLLIDDDACVHVL